MAPRGAARKSVEAVPDIAEVEEAAGATLTVDPDTEVAATVEVVDPPTTPAEGDITYTKEQERAIINEAYSDASKKLRENHRQEFIDLRVAYCKEKGLVWKPAPTKEERAEQEIRELVKANPSLAEKFGIDPATL